jgi:hypothetical protein
LQSGFWGPTKVPPPPLLPLPLPPELLPPPPDPLEEPLPPLEPVAPLLLPELPAVVAPDPLPLELPAVLPPSSPRAGFWMAGGSAPQCATDATNAISAAPTQARLGIMSTDFISAESSSRSNGSVSRARLWPSRNTCNFAPRARLCVSLGQRDTSFCSCRRASRRYRLATGCAGPSPEST